MVAAAASPSSGFIGRERELFELSAGLADVTAGHSHLFLLSGEPGIGKTRLADEFGRLALAQGVRVVWGRCWEEGGAPAYWPWIQVLRACLAGSDAALRAAILGSEAPQVAQDIAQLLPELEGAERMNDCGRAERIREELEFVNDQLLAAIGLKPAVTSFGTSIARSGFAAR